MIPARRHRFRESLSHARGRKKLLKNVLPHFASLDDRFATRLPPSHRGADDVLAQLTELGAGDVCHLVSEAPDLDGQEMLLKDAVTAVVDDAFGIATFISCLPGRLAYFQGEDPDEKFILHRFDHGS